jgi:glucosamine kinase
MVSLGFWLGDEGSGGHLGKLLFRKWYKGEIDPVWHDPIENVLQVQKENALEKLYQTQAPNSWLARLAKLVLENQLHPDFAPLIESSLHAFFSEIVGLIQIGKGLPIHFSGSVALHLKSNLEQKIMSIGCVPGVFIQSPASNLFTFHLQKPTI